MSQFKEIVVKKFLKQSKVAFDVALEGCLKAHSEGKLLYHLVLTSCSDFDGDLFLDFQKLADEFARKDDNGFEFFIVEARNKKEGLHLHVLTAGAYVTKQVLASRWSRFNGALMVFITPFEKPSFLETDYFIDAVQEICRYVTLGNHRESMVRYGYSVDWLRGDAVV